MKKIQCEVCGSTEIKKVGDDLFECQNCGVQYSKNDVSKLLVEITGELKIDHTDDIENLTTRAERFYEDGDTDRALEYYERVLDADPDNENAQVRIDEISQEQDLESTFKDIYAFEAQATKEQCADRFFRSLQSQKNIVHDIYKEISIDSVTEMYYPFSFLKARGTLDWSAIRCDEYFENQTVYHREYNSTKKQWEQVPKTERVIKVNRTPVNGREDWSSSKLVFATNAIASEMNCGNAAKTIAARVEEHLDDIYSSDILVKFDARSLEDAGEIAYYKGIQICTNMDSELVKSRMQDMLSSARSRAENRAANSAGGNYIENMNSHFYVSNNSWVNIFIPICVINYTYKGQKFSAVLNMFQNNSAIELVCPVEKVLDDKDKEVQELETKISKHGHATGVVVATLIIGFIAMGIAAMFNAGVFGVIAMVLWIGGLIYFFVDMAQGKKLNKKKQNIEEDANKNLIEPRRTYLEKTAARFITGYSRYDNIRSIQEALPKSDIEISEFISSKSITINSKGNEEYLNSENESNIKEIRNLAAHSKIEAVKRYIELYGVSLAEAKNAVDKMSENTETDNESLSVDISNDSDSEKEAVLSEIKKIAAQNKIEAIKKYREVFNADLKEAKEAVDKMINQ